MKLEGRNISFAYKKGFPILNDISITIPNDKVIGLIGDSGSGKSTLCKVLSAYIKKYEGNVLMDNKTIDSNGYNPVQLIFQHPEKTMNPKWKMKNILEESWIPPKELRDTFGISDDWLKRWPNELSGGELQRFAILRSLHPKTRFIIADEISTMLDAVTQVQIWDVLLEYAKKQNIGILAVSHDKALLDVVSDDVFYFNELNNK
ncbi:ABC transporter ATP-binding protein [Methanobrevibacter olleyae]|nr:ATP-binding cassette domain-containing protein [Methanobrevibacter olleyae]AMK15652.1 peptide/nickel ABC transporter ATP-binding protein [Methanobrevibacter olleyae]